MSSTIERRAGAARGGAAARHLGADARVHDRVEALALGGIAEHAIGDAGAVERAARVEHVGAEGRGDLGQHRRAGRLQLVDDRVGVDDDGARLGEQSRHRALAGADPACEPDHPRHGAHPIEAHRAGLSATRRELPSCRADVVGWRARGGRSRRLPCDRSSERSRRAASRRVARRIGLDRAARRARRGAPGRGELTIQPAFGVYRRAPAFGLRQRHRDRERVRRGRTSDEPRAARVARRDGRARRARSPIRSCLPVKGLQLTVANAARQRRGDRRRPHRRRDPDPGHVPLLSLRARATPRSRISTCRSRRSAPAARRPRGPAPSTSTVFGAALDQRHRDGRRLRLLRDDHRLRARSGLGHQQHGAAGRHAPTRHADRRSPPTSAPTI